MLLFNILLRMSNFRHELNINNTLFVLINMTLYCIFNVEDSPYRMIKNNPEKLKVVNTLKFRCKFYYHCMRNKA